MSRNHYYCSMSSQPLTKQAKKMKKQLAKIQELKELLDPKVCVLPNEKTNKKCGEPIYKGQVCKKCWYKTYYNSKIRVIHNPPHIINGLRMGYLEDYI